MLVIKDAMVLIHLAKTGVLNLCCTYFGKVAIPPVIHKEVLNGKKQGHIDANLIIEEIEKEAIKIIPLKGNDLIKKANQYNIQRGEAEAVALYWQEKADLLATDDDNVRKKRDALSLNLIGTPAILMRMFRDKQLSTEQYRFAIKILRKEAWFSSHIFDIMSAEVQ